MYILEPTRELELIDDLGICGCASPELAYKAVYDMLKRAEAKECVVTDINDVDPHMLFMAYVLNDKGYLSHGSSVYSSFLTKEGHELLEVLEKFKEYNFNYDEIDLLEPEYFYALKNKEDCSE